MKRGTLMRWGVAATATEQAATGTGAPPWPAALPQPRLATSSARLGDAKDADRAIELGRGWRVFLDRCQAMARV